MRHDNLQGLVVLIILLSALVLLLACGKHNPPAVAPAEVCIVDAVDAGWAGVETPEGGTVLTPNTQWVEGQSVPCPPGDHQ
ncbi:MAG: hypothetical protein CME87_00350 [Herbaspirillum sp.]|nr:hypothetical protein [Herbaspirillum sp.]